MNLICLCTKLLQSCLTFCDLMDCSQPGSSVHGILQARIMIWVAISRASQVAQRLKRLPAMWETLVQSLSQENPLEKETATHSSILAWRIPWMEEPGGLQSTGSQRVGHNWANSLHFPSTGDLLDPGIEPRSPALWVDSLSSEPPEKSLGKGAEVHHKAKNKTALWSNNQYISEENENSTMKNYMWPEFMAALLSIAKMWKPPKYESTYKLYIYTKKKKLYICVCGYIYIHHTHIHLMT